MKTPPSAAIWFSTPNLGLLEVLEKSSVRKILLDIEHGVFEIKETNAFILAAKAMKMEVHAKVFSPEMSAVQQMLDLGVDSIVIPHIKDLAHAEKVCSYTKFPPLGERSCAGGRVFQYGPATRAIFDDQNKSTKCYPMIETAVALRDVDKILALDFVDGVLVGPTDLALSCGREHYEFDTNARDVLNIIAHAANKHGKPWIMPAWSREEQLVSAELGAHFMIVAHEFQILTAGLSLCLEKQQAAFSG